jgi:hypothetical protein
MEDNNNSDSESEKSQKSNGSKSRDLINYPMGDIISNPNPLHVIARFDIYDGYTFRQFYELLKKTVVCAPMFFKKDGINITRGNGKKSFIISAFIDKKYLLDYYVDENEMNCSAEGSHVININLKEFHTQINSLGKKDSFRLVQYRESPNLYCQIYGGAKNNSGYSTVRTEPFVNIKYIDENIDDIEPNCVIPLVGFCNSLKTINRGKYNNTTFRVYPKGFQSITESEIRTSTLNSSWGICGRNSQGSMNGLTITDSSEPSSCSDPPYYDTKIDQNLNKALIGLANLNQGGTMRVFCSEDKVIKCETKLGTFGDINLYIIENSEKRV